MVGACQVNDWQRENRGNKERTRLCLADDAPGAQCDAPPTCRQVDETVPFAMRAKLDLIR